MMFEAERLTSTVAPASASQEDGGIGVQTSSQISTPTENPSSVVDSKIKSVPNGTFVPRRFTSFRVASEADTNCRFS